MLQVGYIIVYYRPTQQSRKVTCNGVILFHNILHAEKIICFAWKFSQEIMYFVTKITFVCLFMVLIVCPSMSEDDLYKVLGVRKTASTKEIKKAYKNLARETWVIHFHDFVTNFMNLGTIFVHSTWLVSCCVSADLLHVTEF